MSINEVLGTIMKTNEEELTWDGESYGNERRNSYSSLIFFACCSLIKNDKYVAGKQ
jgi:hypothetical protein